jgi:hypothetical protein
MVYKNYQRTNSTDKENSRVIQSESESDSDDNTSHCNRSVLSESNHGVELEGEGQNEYFPVIDPEKIFEVGKFIFKLAPQAFFDTFFRETENSYIKFQQRVLDYFDTTVSEWKELEDQPNVFVRDILGGCKVKDVPFISESKFSKAQKYRKEGDKIIMNSSVTTLNIPYSSYFVVEDTWEIVPYEEDKCLIRITSHVNFVKSTFWKNKIEAKTKESYKKEIDLWLEDVAAKGFSYEVYKKKGIAVKEEDEVLLHGVERDVNLNILPKYKQFIHFIQTIVSEYYDYNTRDFLNLLAWCVVIIVLSLIYVKLNRLENILLNKNCQI